MLSRSRLSGGMELNYNIGRKIELKEEVRKLEKDKDSLHKTSLKNAKAHMDDKAEMARLEKKIESFDCE